MQNLILFIQKYYHLFLLLVLESVALYSIIQFNSYHKSWMFNSSSAVTSSVLGVKNEFNYYFNLGTENQRLTEENKILREKLAAQLGTADSADIYKDTLNRPIYQYIPSVIISKTIDKAKNYFLLDKGTKAGVYENMGVITQDGIVGVVVQSSPNISQVMTVLHPDFKLTPYIAGNDQAGSLIWEEGTQDWVIIEKINKHRELEIGDSVFTSQFSASFPPKIPVAVIDELESDLKSSFYTIKAKLTTDFANVRSVYIVKHIYKQEADSLSNEN